MYLAGVLQVGLQDQGGLRQVSRRRGGRLERERNSLDEAWPREHRALLRRTEPSEAESGGRRPKKGTCRRGPGQGHPAELSSAQGGSGDRRWENKKSLPFQRLPGGHSGASAARPASRPLSSGYKPMGAGPLPLQASVPSLAEGDNKGPQTPRGCWLY